ncbi:MAG: tRNA 2-thiouridine(34) synthase MnmA [Phycisphaerales bacterium]|nr:MAG: tRNA 2-thiouridine(34) synthase MnmA [Phycisphaerales bacterium]
MSGGVDSSVAAALLLREGYDVLGCFMRLGSPGEALHGPVPDDACALDAPGTAGAPGVSLRIGHQGCCSIADAADARLVAAKLGVSFYVCNFKKDFGRIIDYFADEYASGRTPNPCVRCNDWLKFGRLHEYAKSLGADYVASGHYARVEREGDDVYLRRGVDHAKDQSYVLFGAPRARLREMLLPIGGFEKHRVRELAKELGLPVFDKPDSQEICFVPDNDYAGMLERRDPALRREGRILDPEGREVGAHEGQHRFTIGQRRGVGVALGYPIYVVGKDPGANTITVGPREMLLSSACAAREVNWLVDPEPWRAWRRCAAKIRYNAEPVDAECRVDVPNDRLEVRFAQPQEAVTPGQAVVCYGAPEDPDLVLGGGWIENAEPVG